MGSAFNTDPFNPDVMITYSAFTGMTYETSNELSCALGREIPALCFDGRRVSSSRLFSSNGDCYIRAWTSSASILSFCIGPIIQQLGNGRFYVCLRHD